MCHWSQTGSITIISCRTNSGILRELSSVPLSPMGPLLPAFLCPFLRQCQRWIRCRLLQCFHVVPQQPVSGPAVRSLCCGTTIWWMNERRSDQPLLVQFEQNSGERTEHHVTEQWRIADDVHNHAETWNDFDHWVLCWFWCCDDARVRNSCSRWGLMWCFELPSMTGAYRRKGQ